MKEVETDDDDSEIDEELRPQEEGNEENKAQVDGTAISRPNKNKVKFQLGEDGSLFNPESTENFSWYNINDKDTYFSLAT